MLFKRKDGTRVKDIDPFTRFVPLIMKERNDALVYLAEEIEIEPLDNYIRKVYKETGNRLSYMHLIYSAMVKTIKERPKINRFIMNGNFYERNDILISMVVKKEMSIDGEETALKFPFKGNETPTDIKEIINRKIELEKDEETEGGNATDMYAKALSNTPTFLFKIFVGAVKQLDKWNLIPSRALEASPFHASAFITNLGSIGLDAGFHHIYNFGTIGTFISIGKKTKKIVKRDGEFKEIKVMKVAFVCDERICDGFYWAQALKTFFRFLSDPENLKD